MAEKKKYWLHRITGGVNGHLLSYPLLRDYNLLSIGWSFISSNHIARDIQKRGEPAIREAYAAENASWSRNAYSLLNFVYKMHQGDIVVVPMGTFLNIYRIADEIIYSNDTIPTDYLGKSQVIKKSDGLATTDGQYIDLGFYRRVEPIALNILRNQAENDLYKKSKALHTNLNITDVYKSVDLLIAQNDKSLSQSSLNSANLITDFELKNYKNITGLRLEGLRRINLFIGKNNVGKSNLLEALLLYVSNWSWDSLMHVLGKRNEKIEDFIKSSFNQDNNRLLNNFAPILPYRETSFLMRRTNNSVILGEKDHFLHLALMNAYYRRDSDTEANRLYQLSPYYKRVSKISSNAELVLVVSRQNDNNSTAMPILQGVSAKTINLFQFTKNGFDYTNFTKQENERTCLLINCKSLSTELAQKLWAGISLTNKEEEILSALKMIDERIDGFNFVNINDRIVPIVRIERQIDGQKQYVRMPIYEMGDGLIHVLNIIITLLSCQNGILLLDEAESGLHYTTQMDLWRMIFQLAEIYNVQIFATTHSNDCLKAFAEASISQNYHGMVARLENNGEEILPVYYNKPQSIIFAINNNFETR